MGANQSKQADSPGCFACWNTSEYRDDPFKEFAEKHPELNDNRIYLAPYEAPSRISVNTDTPQLALRSTMASGSRKKLRSRNAPSLYSDVSRNASRSRPVSRATTAGKPTDPPSTFVIPADIFQEVCLQSCSNLIIRAWMWKMISLTDISPSIA